MQVNSSSTLTILYDGQFWIALCEHREGKCYGARRFVFGPHEPNDEQILEFVSKEWTAIEFALRLFEENEAGREIKRINPKRQQRLVHKALEDAGVGTKAQQAIKAQQEEGKEKRKEQYRDQKQVQKDRQFALRQEKRKLKHRGH